MGKKHIYANREVARSKQKAYEKLLYKITDKAIVDSEIIWDLECAKEDLDFDINWGDLRYDRTALIFAVSGSGRKKLVEYLLSDPNVDVNHKSEGDSTALYFCAQVPILKLLLSHKDIDVNPSNRTDTILHEICYSNRIGMARELLLDARINTSVCDIYGYTAMKNAIRRRHHGIVNMLKRTGRTSLLRIPNASLCRDITRMIIEEYM